MTLGNFLSQMGIDTKHLTERHSHAEYSAPTHDSHMFYAYEPTPSHGHVASSKHHYGGGGHKSNAAMSALTLLAFLFFLHILQQCLKDQMTAMSTPPVMIMTAGREGEEAMSKTSINKIDKTGITTSQVKNNPVKGNDKSKMYSEHADIKYVSRGEDALKETFMKINTAEYTPKTGAHKYKQVFTNYENRSLNFPGFVSAMNED